MLFYLSGMDDKLPHVKIKSIARNTYNLLYIPKLDVPAIYTEPVAMLKDDY